MSRQLNQMLQRTIPPSYARASSYPSDSSQPLTCCARAQYMYLADSFGRQ